jgi:alpha-amylase
MNWSSFDPAVLAHWRKLGTFRARHVALARGHHAKLADSPYTFSRIAGDDRVVVALGAKGSVAIPVAGVFADGVRLRDAYSGTMTEVAEGVARLVADPNGVVLLEPAP